MLPLTGNRKAIVKSMIAKALTSATNVGEALVPEHLEEIITNTIVRMSPELAVIRVRIRIDRTTVGRIFAGHGRRRARGAGCGIAVLPADGRAPLLRVMAGAAQACEIHLCLGFLSLKATLRG